MTAGAAGTSGTGPGGPANATPPGRAARLDVQVEVPTRDVRLDVAPRPGRITAVIGPNGAGKSTLLGAISGAVPARGSVAVEGREILALPAHRRGVSHLRQDPVLFEHLSVLENVAFGPRAAGRGRAAAHRRARALLEEVGASELAPRRPREISGGQAQRVAIARALASNPSLVLLDEPFAALDAEASTHLRALCARMLQGRTVLLVTHDLLDILVLADDVLVLEGGRIAQAGERSAVLARPRTGYAAHLLGKELVHGTVEDVTGDRALLRTRDHGRLVAGSAAAGLRTGGEALALLDPATVRLERVDGARTVPADPAARQDAPTDADAATTHDVVIESVDRVGAGIIVRGGGLAAQIAPERAIAERLGIGSTVRMILDPVRSAIYPGGNERDPAPSPRPHPDRAPRCRDRRGA